MNCTVTGVADSTVGSLLRVACLSLQSQFTGLHGAQAGVTFGTEFVSQEVSECISC